MLLQEERNAVVKYCQKLITAQLSAGTGGNISILNKEKNLVAISPSGMDYFEMAPEDVVVIDLEANIVEGSKKPSSEVGFHLALYKKRQDITAVVHTHSVYATTFACLGEEIPAVHYLVGYSGKKVPLAPYETFGTEALAKTVADNIGDYNALLMQNHGLVAISNTISRAFEVAVEIEFVARLYYQSKSIGEPKLLGEKHMDEALEKFRGYGQQ